MMMTDENSGVSERNELESDEVAVWKDKYVRILADMKNTQNRLARSSAREV